MRERREGGREKEITDESAEKLIEGRYLKFATSG